METVYTVRGRYIVEKKLVILVSAENIEEAKANAQLANKDGYDPDYVTEKFVVDEVYNHHEQKIEEVRQHIVKEQEGKKEMTATEYQDGVEKTRNKFCSEEDEMKNYCLGMSSEVGELIGAIKHHLFHNWELDKPNIVEEMGDIIWYITALARTLNIDLNEILDYNLIKLRERYPDGFDPQKSIDRKEHQTDSPDEV